MRTESIYISIVTIYKQSLIFRLLFYMTKTMIAHNYADKNYIQLILNSKKQKGFLKIAVVWIVFSVFIAQNVEVFL